MKRRTFVAALLSLIVTGCETMNADLLFEIDGGDGDQDFFGQRVVLRRASTSWFPNKLPGWGTALLFQVVEGKFTGEFIAVTSRTNVPLEDHLSATGWGSVIVHRIRNPGPSFNPDKDVDHIGMSVIENKI